MIVRRRARQRCHFVDHTFDEGTSSHSVCGIRVDDSFPLVFNDHKLWTLMRDFVRNCCSRCVTIEKARMQETSGQAVSA